MKPDDQTKNSLEVEDVSGMLLCAKTDEDITPDNDYMMGGNQVSVKTLDLGAEWTEIKTQLEAVAAMIVI